MFHHDAQRDRGMFDLNRCIVLMYAVLIDCEIVAMQVRNKVARGSCTSSFIVTVEVAGSK